MSTATYFTEAARWQLRTALAAVERRDPQVAHEFLDALSEAVRDVNGLQSREQAISEFPDLPHREVRVGGYRLFFRCDGSDLWIVGIWKTRDE